MTTLAQLHRNARWIDDRPDYVRSADAAANLTYDQVYDVLGPQDVEPWHVNTPTGQRALRRWSREFAKRNGPALEAAKENARHRWLHEPDAANPRGYLPNLTGSTGECLCASIGLPTLR